MPVRRLDVGHYPLSRIYSGYEIKYPTHNLVKKSFRLFKSDLKRNLNILARRSFSTLSV